MLFTHVINPFTAVEGSEAARTQEITLAALERAVDHGRSVGCEVEVLGVTFPNEQQAARAPARPVGKLSRTVKDVAPISSHAPFPLCADILEAGHDTGSGRYVVFTNMDICPQPYFYAAMAELIGSRRDAAFVIPRRTIPAFFSGPSDLDKMYREIGIGHEGFDCFVFPREWIPRLDLGTLCIGIPSFDLALILNLEFLTGFRTRLLWSQFLTFHLGDDKAWKDKTELNEHNLQEALSVCRRLEQKAGLIPLRSKFEYVRVWLEQKPAARAPFHLKARRLVQQRLAEWSARWRVRKHRQQLGLPGW